MTSVEYILQDNGRTGFGGQIGGAAAGHLTLKMRNTEQSLS
jgi:hypothetical protein